MVQSGREGPSRRANFIPGLRQAFERNRLYIHSLTLLACLAAFEGLVGNILTGEIMSSTQQTGPATELAERVIAVIRKSAEIPMENITLDTTFEELGFDSVDLAALHIQAGSAGA
ncbi:MAG: acyl carrier protein, partial [Gammaproteobacteria bacterium]|nr:acyl carrier protein [Gammaproteobacteria bacterium]